MPSHRIHRLIDRLILKHECPIVHRYADAVLGKGHRKKWGHTLFHTALLYALTKRKDYAISHIAHILADNLETKNRRLFNMLEALTFKSKKRR